MSQLSKFLSNSVGKKFVMAITGLSMVLFLIEHLSGNLLLFSKDPLPYNKYSDFLLSFGWLIIAAELVLVGILLLHVFSGISIALGTLKARPESYKKSANASGPSKKTFSSTTMIYTGLLTFAFIVIHLKTFKYGAYYEMPPVDGVVMRDLHRLVWEVFRNPYYVAWYVGTLMFLGFHLRHGFWSAFQSLGISYPRCTPLIYSLGLFLSIVIAAGFIGIPLWIYFMGA